MPGDYEVGYKRPPSHTRFEKGRSGNPRGRPKGTLNLATDLAEELGEMIEVRENGAVRRISKQRAMVKSLAAEWVGHGIRVNSISPGYMDTIMNEGVGLDSARNIWLSRNPMRRMGKPDELAGAVVLLASRAGSYINGADILVDGGQTVF